MGFVMDCEAIQALKGGHQSPVSSPDLCLDSSIGRGLSAFVRGGNRQMFPCRRRWIQEKRAGGVDERWKQGCLLVPAKRVPVPLMVTLFLLDCKLSAVSQAAGRHALRSLLEMLEARGFLRVYERDRTFICDDLMLVDQVSAARVQASRAIGGWDRDLSMASRELLARRRSASVARGCVRCFYRGDGGSVVLRKGRRRSIALEKLLSRELCAP